MMHTDKRDAIIAIHYPEDGQLRARKVISWPKARSTGKYPSWKNGTNASLESSDELNAKRLLDANPTVKSFNEQPLTIRYRMDGEVHRHVSR